MEKSNKTCEHVCNAKIENNIYGAISTYTIDNTKIDLCRHCAEKVALYKKVFKVRVRACESNFHDLIKDNKQYYQHDNTIVFRNRDLKDKWRCYSCLKETLILNCRK